MGFQYQMALSFSDDASRHSFTLRCLPGDTLRQRVVSREYMVLPAVDLTENRDAFGNITLEGTVPQGHDAFSVSVQGSVEVPSGDPEEPVPEEVAAPGDEMVFRAQTPRTAPGSVISALLASTSECVCDDLSMAVGLMHRLYSVFRYERGVTGPDTTAEEAMAGGSGVCQDYSHILISMLRSRGIPARYVVGFTVGEGESHAWVEVLVGGLWYGLDPTGNSLVGPRHVKVSHGRDYSDCRINRGVYYGGGTATQQVRAAVCPITIQRSEP